MKRAGFIFLLLFKFSFALLAQSSLNETNNWFFGNYAALNFSGPAPVSFTGSALNTNRCTASLSDQNGNLLFYTNGRTVYNSIHQVMANGTNISGTISDDAEQCYALKQPGSNTIYYIFTLEGFGAPSGFRYSVVDMSLAAGLGSVTAKNQSIYSGSCEPNMAATKHCNGVDYWIVIRSWNRNTNAVDFRSYLLSATGVSLTPVITQAYGWPTTANLSAFSTMKISPNGKKLACARWTSTLIPSSHALELYDFDNSTGVASNSLALLSNGTSTNSTFAGYGCEFSPDGSKLYCGIWPTSFVGGNPGHIVQIDLCAGSPSLIAASAIAVATHTHYEYCYGSMQLARNGKIYFSAIYSFSQPELSVINNPNLPGLACAVTFTNLSVLPGYVRWGLPGFVSNFFVQAPASPPFTYTASNLFGCQTAVFYCPSVPLTTTMGCTANSYTLNNVLWDFGDPLSSSNTSTLTNPTHAFSSLGTYTVKLTYNYSCGGGSDTVVQVVNINQPCFTVNSTSITCATLGSATVVPISGIGPYSYTWYPSGSNGPTTSGLAPGTYSIFVYDAGANFNYSNTVTFVSPILLTGSVLNSTFMNCNSASTGTGQVTNLQGGSGNQSFLWSNGVQSYSTAFTNSLSAGVWSINVTDALTGCQINQSFYIAQPPQLILNLSSNTPTACAGSTIALTGTNSGGTPGYTYTWTNAPPSSTTVVSESVAGTYVYTLSSLDANQCLSSNTIALNFIANPVLSVPDVSICPLKIGTLTASGATSYTWTLSSTTLGLTGPTMTDNPLADTQYTVVGSALGCTSVATASIIVYPVPVPTIQSNSPRCEGTSLDVNASGGSVYQWSGPSSFNSNLPFNTISGLALNHGGTYNLTVTSVNGCTASTSANLIVNPIPTVSAVGSTICTSQTLSLFANSVAGANYNWTGPATFVSAVQNPTLANPALNRTGTYSVIATSVLGCTNIATAQVSVISPPNLSVALSSDSLCAQAFNGSPNTITLTGIGANTYTLYTPNLIGASAPVSPTTSVYATPPFSSTLAVGTATLEGSNGVCSSTASFVFTVVPNPTVGVNSFTPVICAGQNYTYTSNGANSYVWTATTPNYTTYSNGGVAVAHPSINSVFSVYGSSLGCNSALQTSSITVNPIPTLTLSAGSNSICLNENTKLSITGTGTTFTWMPATGLNNTNTSTVTASLLSSQNYTVLVSVANCTNTANLYLTVMPLPKPIIDFVTPAVCLNGQISFKGNGGVLYEWRGPDHLYIQGQNPVFEALSSAYAGNYTLTVTDINGCKSSTVTTVEILPAPSGYLTNFEGEACAPYCATFNFLSGDKNRNVKSSWMINDQFLNGNTFSYCFSTAGAYTINGTFLDETTNCKNTASYLLNVHPKPKADFIYSPKQPVEGLDEVIFSNNSFGDGNLSFNWYFNDNKGYSTTQKNTSYLYNEPGEYRVVLVSKNNWKCADTIIKVIKVESDFALYVPNAFTPNGDERNDVFLPVVRSVKKYNLQIFDRWGRLIFQTSDPNQGWDGTFNGMLCKQDVYIWKIHVVSLDGKEKFETGNLTSLPSE